MKVLHVLGYPLTQGGHIQSCLDLLTYLEKGQHALVGYNGSLNRRFQEVVKTSLATNKMGYIVQLAVNIASFKPDIIHCWDYKALKILMFLRPLYFNRIFYTKAGGEPITSYLPDFDGFVVFSKELYNFYESCDSKNLLLLSQRMNLSDYQEEMPEQDPGILTLGIFMRHSKEKLIMFRNLVEILRSPRLKKVHLHVAGSGEFTHKINSDLNSIKNIELTYHGMISDRNELNKLRAKCDVVVGHGRGIIEAATMGIPILLLAYKNPGSSFVRAENFDDHASINMSGRSLPSSDHSETIEILVNRKYRCESFDLRTLIADYYSSKRGAKILEQDYLRSMNNYIISKRIDLKWMLRFLVR